MSKKLPLIIVSMLAACLLCSYPVAAANIPGPQYLAADGKPVSIAADKPVTLLVVFKPDCKDCQAELPIVGSLAQNNPDTLNVALLVYGRQPADIAEYVERFQSIGNIAVYADPDKLSKTQYSIHYVPYLVFSIPKAHNSTLSRLKAVLSVKRFFNQ